MKTVCYFIVSFFSAALAMAGLPAVDLNVHLVQETYARARDLKPEKVLDELQTGRPWTCNVIYAYPNGQGASNAVELDALRFEQRGPSFVNVGRWGSNFKYNEFSFTADELFQNRSERDLILLPGGVLHSEDTRWTVRALDGALLLELSVAASPRTKSWSTAIADPTQKAYSYLYCMLSRYERGDRRAFNSLMTWQFSLVGGH